MLHRDDLPFEVVTEIEKSLGKNLVFPGDMDEVPPHIVEKIRKNTERATQTFNAGECFRCGKKIEDVKPEELNVEAITFNNWQEHWTSRQCLPGFRGLSEEYGGDGPKFTFCCNECAYGQDGPG